MLGSLFDTTPTSRRPGILCIEKSDALASLLQSWLDFNLIRTHSTSYSPVLDEWLHQLASANADFDLLLLQIHAERRELSTQLRSLRRSIPHHALGLIVSKDNPALNDWARSESIAMFPTPLRLQSVQHWLARALHLSERHLMGNRVSN